MSNKISEQPFCHTRVSCTNAGGITGFMAGCVAQIVAECHERGFITPDMPDNNK